MLPLVVPQQSEQGNNMNRLDLIIDALEKVINACKLYDRQDIQDGGTVYLEEELEVSIKALAAARELRDLKPVAWADRLDLAKDGNWDTFICKHSSENHERTRFKIPLYALDGEQA